MPLSPEELEKGERQQSSTDSFTRDPYKALPFYVNDTKLINIVAPAPNAKTWAGFIDATYFQFQKQQPAWYFSDDFLHNTLDRLLGFDPVSKIWRPLKVDSQGQIVTSGSLTLSIPPVFEDDFNGIILDTNLWDSAGTITIGSSAVNLQSDGAFIRTKNFFTRTATKPLILTVESFLEEEPDGVSGSNYSFGFMDATESNPASGTLQNGIFCKIHYDAAYLVDLISVVDGTEESLESYELTSSSDVHVFQLVVEEYAAYVYVDGVQRIAIPTTTFTEVAPERFPNTSTFRVFLLNENAGLIANGDYATFYRLSLSQVDEAILIGGYDVNGYKAFARFSADGRLLVDTEISVVDPINVTVTDFDFTVAGQTSPVEVTFTGTNEVTITDVNIPTQSTPLTVDGAVTVDGTVVVNPTSYGKTSIVQFQQAANATQTIYTVAVGKVFYLTLLSFTAKFNGAISEGHNCRVLIDATILSQINAQTSETVVNDAQNVSFAPSVPMPFPAGTVFYVYSSAPSSTGYASILGWEEDA